MANMKMCSCTPHKIRLHAYSHFVVNIPTSLAVHLPILNYKINSACIDFLINLSDLLLLIVVFYCCCIVLLLLQCYCTYILCCCSNSFWLPLLKLPDIHTHICTTIIERRKWKILTARLFFSPFLWFFFFLLLHVNYNFYI